MVNAGHGASHGDDTAAISILNRILTASKFKGDAGSLNNTEAIARCNSMLMGFKFKKRTYQFT